MHVASNWPVAVGVFVFFFAAIVVVMQLHRGRVHTEFLRDIASEMGDQEGDDPSP